MNLEHALKIPGFTYDVELEWLAKQASTKLSIAEVGCWKGRSTRAMAQNTRGTVYAVDTWLGTNEDRHIEELKDKPVNWLLQVFVANMQGLTNVVRCQGPSIEMAEQCRKAGDKFDMLFIDAAHDYESVKADLKAWMPLLTDDGLLAGHDFDGGRPGVVRAVRELVPGFQTAGVGSIWYRGNLE